MKNIKTKKPQDDIQSKKHTEKLIVYANLDTTSLDRVNILV